MGPAPTSPGGVLAQEKDAPAEALRRSLHAVLGDHNLKEEKILYPTTDELLGPEKADRLVERIQRF